MNRQQDLEKQAERFVQLFNNSGAGIFIVDKERLIVEANGAFCKIFGYSYDEIILQSALSLHLSYAAYVKFADIAFNKVRQNESLNLEYQFRHKEGHTLWLRIAGDPLPSNEEVLWTITDITDTIEAQAKLRNSEELLRNAEAISHLGSWEVDLRTHAMTWSEEMYRIYGEDRESFTPTLEKFDRYLCEVDAKRVKALNQQAIESGEAQKIDYEICRRDGTKAFINTQRKALYGESGSPLKLVGTSLDITLFKENERRIHHLNERLHLEVQLQLEKLREKDKQLQFQSRLAQMGEMLSMIAHQWRQPLAAISATTGLLSMKLVLDEFDAGLFGQEIKRIEAYAGHLSRTIDDFRSFFNPTRQREETTLESIVDRTLTVVRPVLDSQGIDVVTLFECEGSVLSHKNELGQVLLSIIKNAQDALLENKPSDPRIDISTRKDEAHLYLVVKDNAGGIDDSIKDRIFDAYFSTKSDKGGTGVGLCMSRTIVEEHCQGRLWADNSDVGAVFTIRLPRGDI